MPPCLNLYARASIIDALHDAIVTTSYVNVYVVVLIISSCLLWATIYSYCGGSRLIISFRVCGRSISSIYSKPPLLVCLPVSIFELSTIAAVGVLHRHQLSSIRFEGSAADDTIPGARSISSRLSSIISTWPDCCVYYFLHHVVPSIQKKICEQLPSAQQSVLSSGTRGFICFCIAACHGISAHMRTRTNGNASHPHKS